MLRDVDVRANSMLITVFGDAIAPRRQSVWLGSLIALLERMGLSSRLVRTSAFRLTADGWFTASREGRRSYYGLSEAGMHGTFALTRVADAWNQFILRFSPLQAELPQWDPSDAFIARSLLIHEYRRVLLRDPNLPKAFLPADWPGVQARRLCEQLYSSLLKPSEAYLRAVVQTRDGALAPTPSSIRHRLSRPVPPDKQAALR